MNGPNSRFLSNPRTSAPFEINSPAPSGFGRGNIRNLSYYSGRPSNFDSNSYRFSRNPTSDASDLPRLYRSAVTSNNDFHISKGALDFPGHTDMYDDLSATSGNYNRNIVNSSHFNSFIPKENSFKSGSGLDPDFAPSYEQSDNPLLAAPETPKIELPPVAEDVSEASALAEDAASVAKVASDSDPAMLPLIMAAQAANEAVKSDFKDTVSKELGNQQTQYNVNVTGQGQFGNSMHAGLHAQMLLDSQRQTALEKENFMNTFSTFTGPVSSWIAGKFEDQHVSDQEKNLNFNTAHSDTGQMVNPDDYAQHAQDAEPAI